MVIKQAQKAGQQTRLFCPILFLSFTHKTEHVILASIIRNNGNFLEVVCSLSSQRLDCSVKAGVFHIAPLRRPKNVMARALHPKISDSLRKLLALLLLLNYMYTSARAFGSEWGWPTSVKSRRGVCICRRRQTRQILILRFMKNVTPTWS